MGRIIFQKEFDELVQKKMVVDGIDGGLVIGRSHNDGNIYMIRQLFPEKIFEFCSNLQGGEYLICYDAYTKYKNRIEEINAYKQKGDKVDLFDVCKCSIILTKNEPDDKFILIDHRGQFVVNKRATSKFLYEIDCINKLIW